MKYCILWMVPLKSSSPRTGHSRIITPPGLDTVAIPGLHLLQTVPLLVFNKTQRTHLAVPSRYKDQLVKAEVVQSTWGQISRQVIAMVLYSLGVSTVLLMWSSLVGSGSPLWHCWLSLNMSSHPHFLVDTISDQLGGIHVVREECLHDHGRAMTVPETNYSTRDNPWECFRETFIVLNILIPSTDNIVLYC